MISVKYSLVIDRRCRSGRELLFRIGGRDPGAPKAIAFSFY